MKTTSMIELSVPSPFGWVTMTQPAPDLTTLAAFRRQLVSLEAALATQNDAIKTIEPEQDAVLVYVRPRV